MSDIKIFSTHEDLHAALASELELEVKKHASQNRHLYLAVSGGNTPRGFFTYVATHVQKRIPWHYVHFYWVDERCVPPTHSDSNYGMAAATLLQKIALPSANIHRIYGEADPNIEVKRYRQEIENTVPSYHGLPQFDWILLGMGSDGHTASLFPGDDVSLGSGEICALSHHPQTAQPRITLTLKVINHALRVTFVLLDKDKRTVFSEIVNKHPTSSKYPAAWVCPTSGRVEWYAHKEVAEA